MGPKRLEHLRDEFEITSEVASISLWTEIYQIFGIAPRYSTRECPDLARAVCRRVETYFCVANAGTFQESSAVPLG